MLSTFHRAYWRRLQTWGVTKKMETGCMESELLIPDLVCNNYNDNVYFSHRPSQSCHADLFCLSCLFPHCSKLRSPRKPVTNDFSTDFSTVGSHGLGIIVSCILVSFSSWSLEHLFEQ